MFKYIQARCFFNKIRVSVVLVASLLFLSGCTTWLASEVMSTGDINGDGIITLEEWGASHDAKPEKNMTKEENTQMFISIDKNGDKQISRAEVDYFLTEPSE